jgi:hypothetical protein
MKLTEKAKKRLTLAGLGIVCVVLIVAIASQFKTEVPKEAEVQPSTATSGSVNPSVPTTTPATTDTPTSAPEVSVQPIVPTESASKASDTGDSSGTKQNIQAEVTKPAEPSEEAKTNPSQTPDGQKVTKSDSNTSSTPKSGDKNSKGQVYVPGFGWVDDEGANSGTSVDGKGDINKQVGNMD